MSSPVYFANIDRIKFRGLILMLDDLFQQAGFDSIIEPGETVAIKMHTGDEYSPHTIRPGYIRRVVENIKNVGGIPIVSDACQLYKISKFTSNGLIESARTNGFDASTLGAPVVPADGYNITYDHPLRCEDELLEIPDGGLIKKCEIASLFVNSDAMIVCARVSPYPDRRSVLKHIGMGCSSKRGKARIHRSSTPPIINKNKCSGCGICTQYCAWHAIDIIEGHAKINYKKCAGCCICIKACEKGGNGGLVDCKYVYRNPGLRKQLGVVDAAAALIRQKKGKCGYIVFLLDYVDECENWTTRPMFPDIGVLASLDPVAVDAAAYDLIAQAPFMPNTIGDELPPNIDKIDYWRSDMGYSWEAQLAHAERLGIGTRKYELIEVDPTGSKYDYHGMPGYAVPL